jgi:hypothetical protein
MKFPSFINGDASTYWQVVELCLVEVFQLPRATAKSRLATYRADLEKTGLAADPLVYHQEPINTAADLAGKHYALDAKTAKAYEAILKKVA